LSQTLLDLAKNNVATAFDLRRLQGETAGSLQTTGVTLAQRFGLDVANDMALNIKSLRDETKGLRDEARAHALATVGKLADMNRTLDGWSDGDAMNTRVVA
jgi:hypothetical protein